MTAGPSPAPGPPANSTVPREVAHGRIPAATAAPVTGERVEELVLSPGFRVCQISSGTLEVPVDFLQDQDEFALVVSGSAVLEAAGEVLSLRPGDWVWLPAGTPHRLVQTEEGTTWLTVHGESDRPAQP